MIVHIDIKLYHLIVFITYESLSLQIKEIDFSDLEKS